MQSRVIRVLPAEVGWQVEFGDLDLRPQRFPTMEAAIAAGWDVARRENVDLHIRRHDGDVYLRNPRGEK